MTLQWHEAAVGKLEVPSGPASSLFVVQAPIRDMLFPTDGLGQLRDPQTSQ